ncbi:MAG: aminotransferase class I/II-fold pyridoxal phosphate-dependent enzyme [Holophagales bacterium]|nr:aminotransferase class I/II-fold pyridoxal phosphate-dependent enzyme [Holophagales bacterium]
MPRVLVDARLPARRGRLPDAVPSRAPLPARPRDRRPRPSHVAPKRLVCFDSNSYLGLHLHPRVTAAARKALDEAGAGTPSAPLLSGTSRWLRELEEVVAAFHGREAALVFPSGYAANIGILTGLLRPGDFAVRDRYSHASLHDGCRYSGARGSVYAHGDPASAARSFARDDGRGGKLLVTDGVFSMHGSVAPLPGSPRWPRAPGPS